MKMIKFGVAVIGLLMSANILAANKYDDTTDELTVGVVEPVDCGALRGAAKVNLSSGVVGALHCRSIYGDAIIGACHAKGNVKPSTVNCGCADTSTTAIPNYGKNVSICPGTCDAATGQYTPADTVAGVDSVLVAGRKAFGAMTSGGQLQTFSLGDTGLCDVTNLKGVKELFP